MGEGGRCLVFCFRYSLSIRPSMSLKRNKRRSNGWHRWEGGSRSNKKSVPVIAVIGRVVKRRMDKFSTIRDACPSTSFPPFHAAFSGASSTICFSVDDCLSRIGDENHSVENVFYTEVRRVSNIATTKSLIALTFYELFCFLSDNTKHYLESLRSHCTLCLLAIKSKMGT